MFSLSSFPFLWKLWDVWEASRLFRNKNQVSISSVSHFLVLYITGWDNWIWKAIQILNPLAQPGSLWFSPPAIVFAVISGLVLLSKDLKWNYKALSAWPSLSQFFFLGEVPLFLIHSLHERGLYVFWFINNYFTIMVGNGPTSVMIKCSNQFSLCPYLFWGLCLFTSF